ncbi:alpha-amylase family glycosyl hydrolase [Cellulomonas sp. URHD0024]|uniref:alpha-amylase family glycosyl hydrolase n=1 Tax=Cellulomonas sp. URHD0024 TaxID=1302620 RepID=UPI0004284F3E|nr:alpha-amylase family glycosyl hydrolase [Cellulomonas sp. URHD0024]
MGDTQETTDDGTTAGDGTTVSDGVNHAREPDWVRHAIWWHAYPLGFVGAYPQIGATPDEHRLRRMIGWFDHVIAIGASGVALGPIFASESHGYDTVDHLRIDPRLGTDEDFDVLVDEAHSRGLRVLLDGVFNHVGRSSRIARRSIEAAEGRTDDEVWLRRVEGSGPTDFASFEGHGSLVTLDHEHPSVVDYVVRVMNHWLDRGADGWRLDAAYAVPTSFWAQALPRVRAEHPDAWVVAEVIHGDYAEFVNESGVDSLTQYELWKAIWSSIEDANLWELAWSLQRHDEFLDTFVPMTFVGNHDVTRIASKITDPRHVAHAFVVLFTVGGTPSLYAGDELGYTGVKEDRIGGDDAVRPEFAAQGPGADGSGPDGPGADGPEADGSAADGSTADERRERAATILRLHQDLVGLRRRHPWLHGARTSQVELANERFVYEVRSVEDPSEALVVVLNIGDDEVALPAGEVLLASTQSGAVSPHGWAIVAR